MKQPIPVPEEVRQSVIDRVAREEGLSEAVSTVWFDEMLKFLDLSAALQTGELPPAEVVPSRGVDKAWHAFILHTEHYIAYCERVCGAYMHHHIIGNVEADVRSVSAYAFTQRALIERFGRIESAAWPPAVHMAGLRDDLKSHGSCVLDRLLGSEELHALAEQVISQIPDSSDHLTRISGDSIVLGVVNELTEQFMIPIDTALLGPDSNGSETFVNRTSGARLVLALAVAGRPHVAPVPAGVGSEHPSAIALETGQALAFAVDGAWELTYTAGDTPQTAVAFFSYAPVLS